MATPPYPLPRETRQTNIQIGNGTAGPYGPTPFRVFDIEDVEVWTRPTGAVHWSQAEGVFVAKTSGAGFDTVSVSFGTVVPVSTQFVIFSRRLHERQIAVFKAGVLDADQLEKELSRQGTVLEELRRDVDNGLQLPPLTGGRQVKLGASGDTVVFDAAGNLIPGFNQNALGDLIALGGSITTIYNSILAIYADITNISIALGASAAPGYNGGRPSLSPVSAVPLADMMDAPQIYFVPYTDDKVAIWSNAANTWKFATIDPTKPLRLTVDLAGTTSNGSTVITGLSDTSDILVGMRVVATGIPANTGVVSKTANSVTLSAAASASGTVTVSFRLTANLQYDFGCRNVGGVARLEIIGTWGDDIERQYALGIKNGVLVSPFSDEVRFLGTFRTIEYDGATEDSRYRRWLSPHENRVERHMEKKPTASSWTHGATTWRAVEGDINNALDFIAATPRETWARASLIYTAAATCQYGCGIGLDSPTNLAPGFVFDNSTERSLAYISAVNDFQTARASWRGDPGVGRHRLNWLEYGNASVVPTVGGRFFGASLEELCETAIIGGIEN